MPVPLLAALGFMMPLPALAERIAASLAPGATSEQIAADARILVNPGVAGATVEADPVATVEARDETAPESPVAPAASLRGTTRPAPVGDVDSVPARGEDRTTEVTPPPVVQVVQIVRQEPDAPVVASNDAPAPGVKPDVSSEPPRLTSPEQPIAPPTPAPAPTLPLPTKDTEPDVLPLDALAALGSELPSGGGRAVDPNHPWLNPSWTATGGLTLGALVDEGAGFRTASSSDLSAS